MDKDKLIQCVPVEMIQRLHKLLERLWGEKNPASVHLAAIMDEFASELKSLSGVVKEYESDYAGRLEFVENQYKEKIRSLEADIADFKSRLAGFDGARTEAAKKISDLSETLKHKEAEISEFKAAAAEGEAQLNSRYVSKMQELYDKVGRKEMEMLAHWEEKNKLLESRINSLETDYASKFKQLKLREKALEDDFNARREELVRTFEKIRIEFEAKEKEVATREEKVSALEKKHPRVTQDL